MPEPDFRAARQQLEDLAHQPDFDVIVGRRTRRTRGWAVAGAATLTSVMVFAGISLGSGRHEPAPPSTPASPAISASIESLAASPSGALYAVRMEGDMPHLRKSTDLGVTWADLGRVSEPGRVVVADDQVMWVIGETEIYGTSNAGKDWNSWQSAHVDAYSVVGQRLWLAYGNALAYSDAGADPMMGGPYGAVTYETIVAFDNTVIVYAADANDVLKWYRSDDGGHGWLEMANPCAQTTHPGDRFARLAVAPDGAMWTVCPMTAGAGQQPKDLAVSTDGGQTWKSRGALESSGYGVDVYPFSATMAWRTGARADLYRTTDGVHWTDLVENGAGTIKSFVAIDAETAAYADEEGLHVTTDGGTTWVTRA